MSLFFNVPVLTPAEWIDWKCNFYTSYHKHELRLGQAYMNTYMPNMANPLLFYASNQNAMDFIEKFYVDWEGEVTGVSG